MRKKDLVQQNLMLTDSLRKTQTELGELRKQLNVYAQEIKNLKTEISTHNEEQAVVTEPMRRLEEKVITNATMKPDMEYGAKIIGKIVVSAAEHSNKLTVGVDDSKKELVNLILGKTEMAKAEILSVIESDDDFGVKCTKMDQIATVSKEYFESILAQIV